MTVIFHDIHQDLDDILAKDRVNTTNFDEILFADDTICISENAKTLTKFLRKIQTEGGKYGLLLNMDKCEVIRISRNHNLTEADQIRFQNGKAVSVPQEAKY